MASTDARPVPRRNVACRVTFPILDADGDLVTGAAALDSEVSKDGGAFADATSEATEIATASGVYFLDLTATEMDADTVAVIVKTSTADAKTTVIVMYPETAGDYRTDVTHWNGVAVAVPTVAGVPEVDATHVGGTLQTAGDVIGDTNDIQSRLPAALVGGRIDASVGSMGADVISAAQIAAGAIGAAEAPNLDAAVSTRATPAQVNAEVVDALNVDTYAEPGQEAPPATATLVRKLGYLYKFLRNRVTSTATQISVFNDDAVTVDQKSAHSDDGTTYDRGEFGTGP